MVLCVTCFMQLKRAVETLIACVCESEKVREMAKNSIKKAKIKIVFMCTISFGSLVTLACTAALIWDDTRGVKPRTRHNYIPAFALSLHVPSSLQTHPLHSHYKPALHITSSLCSNAVSQADVKLSTSSIERGWLMPKLYQSLLVFVR